MTYLLDRLGALTQGRSATRWGVQCGRAAAVAADRSRLFSEGNVLVERQAEPELIDVVAVPDEKVATLPFGPSGS